MPGSGGALIGGLYSFRLYDRGVCDVAAGAYRWRGRRRRRHDRHRRLRQCILIRAPRAERHETADEEKRGEGLAPKL